MQTQIQAMLLSVQKTVVDRNIYAKAFIALPADNEKDAVSSVMQLGILEEKADAVFRSVVENGIKLGELVTLDVEIVRGGQNTIKQVVHGITSAQRPLVTHQTKQQGDQPKADSKA